MILWLPLYILKYLALVIHTEMLKDEIAQCLGFAFLLKVGVMWTEQGSDETRLARS